MKTTIDIADNILERSRRLSKAESIPLKSLVEEGLELVLERRTRENKVAITPVTFKGNGLSTHYRDASWTELRDTVYRGRGS